MNEDKMTSEKWLLDAGFVKVADSENRWDTFWKSPGGVVVDTRNAEEFVARLRHEQLAEECGLVDSVRARRREFFAGLAMRAFISREGHYPNGNKHPPMSMIVSASVEYADAMVAALDGETE